MGVNDLLDIANLKGHLFGVKKSKWEKSCSIKNMGVFF